MAMIVPGFNDRYTYGGELYHHGVKGQKHGVRRYQNEDGTLTMLGRRHYDIGMGRIPSNPAQASARVKSTAARTNYNANNPSSTTQKAMSGVGSYTQTKANYGNQSNTEPYLSEEYKRDMAFNSRKNNYFGNNPSSATSKTTQPQAKANYNSQSNTEPYLSEEYKRDMAFNSRKNNFDQLAYEQAQVQSQYDNSWQGQANNLTRSAQRGMSAGVNRVGQMLGTAATNAWNTASGAVGSAAGEAKRRVGEAKRRVGEAAGNVRDRATDAWNTASGAVNSAAGEAKRRVGEAAGNVGKAAKGAYDSAREYVTGERAKGRVDKANAQAERMGKESTSLSRQAQDMYERNTLPGQVQRAGRAVNNAATTVRDAATNAWNTASGAVGSAAGEAKRRVGEAAGNVRDRATDAWNTASGAVGSAAGEAKRRVGEAKRRVGEAAGNVRDRATDAWNTASGAVNSAAGEAKRRVGEAAGNVGKAAKGAYDSAREYVTGEKAKQRVDTANKLAAKRGVESNDLTRAAQEQYERNTLPGQVQRAGRAVRDAAVDGWNGASQFVSDRAGEISTFASTMADNAGTAIKNLPQTASNLIDSGKTMVGDAAAAVGGFMSDRVSDVTGVVGGAFSKGAEFAKEAWKIMKWPF